MKEALGETASQRVLRVLTACGRRLGYEVEREYLISGAKIDVVWTSNISGMPGNVGPIPIVGFEIESGMRARKYIKGDYLNLFDLGASLGVIILLGEDERLPGLLQFAAKLADRPGPRILVWTEADVMSLNGIGS